MKLIAASLDELPGLMVLLLDVGDGENGFTGTSVHTGDMTLRQFLQYCCGMADPADLHPGLVPQTVFWAVDDQGEVIGMIKVRHYLNDKLRIHGGHIGYYVRRDKRGQGHGTQALALALAELKKLGETRALITVRPDNIPSLRVVERNGGVFEDFSADPITGAAIKRYWIDL